MSGSHVGHRSASAVTDAICQSLEHSLGWSLEDVAGISSGRSAMTLSATVRSAPGTTIEVFIRADWPGDGIGLHTSVDQADLLDVVREHAVLAPKPLHAGKLDTDDGVLGLLVTERIPGHVPDPWTGPGRRHLGRLRREPGFRRDFVDQMARIHEIPLPAIPEAIRREDPDPAGTYPQNIIDRADASIRNHPAFRFDPVLRHKVEDTQRHLPDDRHRSGLVHGDFRMGNMVVRDDALVGILDWELAEPGDVLSDVAWLYGPQALTDGFVGGLFGSDELAATYQEVTGRTVDARLLDYYVSLGSLRTAIIWVTIASWEGMRAGDPGCLRAAFSVAQIKQLLASRIEQAWPEQSVSGGGSVLTDPRLRSDLHPLIHGGVALLSGMMAESIRSASETDRTLALRTSRRLLDSIHELLSTDSYSAYDGEVLRLTGDIGDVADWPGRILSRLGTDADENTRMALHTASKPVPAFGDLVCSVGAEGSGLARYRRSGRRAE